MDGLKELKQLLTFGLLTAAFYATLDFLGVGCPIRFFTGISCPGCGMTRAYFSLLRLDFIAAFRYHPLFPLPPVLLLFYILKELRRFPEKAFRAAVWVFCGAFLAVWLLRMLWGDGEVVSFEPENGFFARILRYAGTLAGKTG